MQIPLVPANLFTFSHVTRPTENIKFCRVNCNGAPKNFRASDFIISGKKVHADSMIYRNI